MPGVVAALAARTNGGGAAEDVDELAFAFVAPLATEDYRRHDEEMEDSEREDWTGQI